MSSSSKGHRFDAGLSLVELMIALALGIIIVAAMSELFVGISRSNQEMAKTNSQIESARFAMQYLENDIVHAGYWGGYLPEWDDFAREDPLTYTSITKRDPCSAYGPWSDEFEDAFISIPVEVFSDAPNLCDTSGGPVDSTYLQPNTDVLVIRHAGTIAKQAGDPNDALYMQVSNCFDPNDPVPELEGTPYLLSNDPNDFTLRERNCVTTNLTPQRRWVQNIYYIRDHAVTPGDGIPTLVRSSFGLTGSTPAQQPPVPLVEGIERFRVEMGIDRRSHTGELVSNFDAIQWANEDERIMPRNRGNGVAEGRFERCFSDVSCSEDDLMNVVAIKLYLLARSSEQSIGYTDTKKYVLGSGAEIGPFGDSFKRHVFSTTVRLNNVSGRRDTPYDPNGT